MSIERALQSVRQLRDSVRAKNPPPEEGAPSHEEPVIYFSLVRNTRGYLERLVHQINGSYEHGWYDASAVMIRRLVETLIIEVYERYGLADSIKTVQGDFFYLRDLISAITAEKSWNLSKNAKAALPRLKDVGDMSAHSRRFIAQRQDIDRMMADLRVIVQELMTLAALK
ncbi:hypothetical protein VP02_17340 [Pseudomonas ogarae]|uniref:Uncharacterized protein n=1 Tax=Pseudomonas kilonensis TaxID=132476 RepID=A0A0F4XLG7_9PSED|nr:MULTISPECIES: DUF4145 domain-containing protein [Pseudomonas fluorescens group]KKA06656.1 hypothetical protein VP02_17340 [Pseudomonas ogarae]MBA1429228.1 DUF4145 domain-containing protein [Pseudomonas orientalis]